MLRERENVRGRRGRTEEGRPSNGWQIRENRDWRVCVVEKQEDRKSLKLQRKC